MAYQKKSNDLGAAWQKISNQGNTFLSVRLDCTHSPETAKALANMLMSGQPISLMASENSSFDPNNPKVPRYSLYMSQQQHTWTLQAYNQVYNPTDAPQFDYKNPIYQPADNQQSNYSAPPSAPAPVQPAPTPPAAPVAPPAAQVETVAQPPYPPAPVAPEAPAEQATMPSSPPVPQNPFGA